LASGGVASRRDFGDFSAPRTCFEARVELCSRDDDELCLVFLAEAERIFESLKELFESLKELFESL
jgi:hypothetical protein